MKVSIIIPVFNQVEYTVQCVDSLLADRLRPDFELIIVDNASSDGTAEYLSGLEQRLKSDSKVRFVRIQNATNLGVAPAWNQGLRAATGEQLLVINNDILATDGWIQGMLIGAQLHGLALVCPFAIHGKLDYQLPDRAKKFVARNAKRIWKEYSFCAFMMPRSTYQLLGDFDENFKVGGYEDTDYCYRVREKGLKYGIVGSSFIHHFGSITLGEFKRLGDKHVGPNLKYFIQKWNADPGKLAARFPAKMRRSIRRLKMRWDWM